MTHGPKYTNRLKGASRDWLSVERGHLISLYQAKRQSIVLDTADDVCMTYAEMAEIRGKLAEVSMELARRA